MNQHTDSAGRKWEIVEDDRTGQPTFVPIRDEYRFSPDQEEKFAEIDDTLRRHRAALIQLEQRLMALELGGEPTVQARPATPATVFLINKALPAVEHAMDVLAGHKDMFEKVKLTREFEHASGYYKAQREYLRRTRHNPPGMVRLRGRLDDLSAEVDKLLKALDAVDKQAHGAERTKLTDAVTSEIKQPLELIAAESRAS
jgi:hypothetical protein